MHNSDSIWLSPPKLLAVQYCHNSIPDFLESTTISKVFFYDCF